MVRRDLIERDKTWVPLDLMHFQAQGMYGPGTPPLQFSMRKGIVDCYKHLGQVNLVLAAKLIPLALSDPDGVFQNWKDLCRRGISGNIMYTRGFGNPTLVNGVEIPVPKHGDVFGILADKDFEILDYGWFERSSHIGLPEGHDNPDVIGGVLWRRN